MRMMSLNKKLVLASISSVLVGTVGAVGVMAAIPSIQGVINGCYSNQNGQLRIIDQAGTCTAGQTNLQWDRGVIAYAHLVAGNGTQELIIPAGQSQNISIIASNPDMIQTACLTFDPSIEDKIRFASVAPSTNGMFPQIMIRDKSQDENDTLAAYCTPEADAVFIGGGAAYVSFY